MKMKMKWKFISNNILFKDTLIKKKIGKTISEHFKISVPEVELN
jgi:hypothetical protein